MTLVSDLSYEFDWDGNRLRIWNAKLYRAADADALIQALTRLRGILPGGDEPQAATGLAPASAAGRAHNPIPAATVSAQAEVPEAGVSEHPEAHSMATGGKQDAGTSASGHENAEALSAGGRAEIDASPAAPNTETTGPLPSAGEAEASPASRRLAT